MNELKINWFELFKSDNHIMFNVVGESNSSCLILKQSSPDGKNYYNDILCNENFDYTGRVFDPKNLGKSLTDSSKHKGNWKLTISIDEDDQDYKISESINFKTTDLD